MVKILPYAIQLAVISVISSSTLAAPLFQSVGATVGDFSFASVGDWGCKSASGNTVENIVSKNTDLTLGLGDYSYATTADCWLSIVSPLDDQIKIAIGNHDDENTAKLQQFMSHFSLSQQYYSFDYENVHFLAISTELPLSTGSAQHTFVKNDLADAASDINTNWIVVYYHKLAYTSPGHHLAETTLRNTYHPLFDQYGVDLVLQAHNHNYERSYPIRFNAASPANPIVTDSSAIDYEDPTGQIFATVGTGGQSVYSFTGKSAHVAKQYVGYGFLNVDILDGGLTMTATYYANDGTVRDQFTITKEDLPPGGYDYDPSLQLTGSNYRGVTSSSSLQLTQFTLATWFKTTKDYGSNAYIVTKGGFGSEATGNNNNYGIWMTNSETIRAGFETKSGVDYIVGSPTSYSDGIWHYSVATYDGSSLRLYLDGTQVASRSTSGAMPDNTSTKSIRVGANSFSANGFFTGSADEVRVWNRALSASDIAAQYDSGTFNTAGQVLHLPFS